MEKNKKITSPDTLPLGGQVYKATLRANGKPVAVKVQRPGVLETVSLDLHLARELGYQMKKVGRVFVLGLLEDVRVPTQRNPITFRTNCSTYTYSFVSTSMETYWFLRESSVRDLCSRSQFYFWPRLNNLINFLL